MPGKAPPPRLGSTLPLRGQGCSDGRGAVTAGVQQADTGDVIAERCRTMERSIQQQSSLRTRIMQAILRRIAFHMRR